MNAVSVVADGRHLLSGSRDRTLRLWDSETGSVVRTFAGHENAVSSVSVSTDGHYALSGSDDGTVKYWNLATSQTPRISVGHEGSVTAVSVSPDGCHALSARATARSNSGIWQTVSLSAHSTATTVR